MSLDSILNIVIPTLLILVVIGFVWTKLLGPWLGPWISNTWDKMIHREVPINMRKEIIYE